MRTESDKPSFQILQLGQLRVVGEQDGAPERILKSRLVPVLQRHADVQAAYLTRVKVASSEEDGVALCLVSEADPDEQLVGEIGQVFADVFTSDAHLDILFLRLDQEEQVAPWSRSFFSVRQSTQPPA